MIIINDNKLQKEKKGLDIVWDHLYKFGYNNMLEKDKYDLDYIKRNVNKFEELNPIFKNFLQISDKIIHKLSLGYIDKIFIQHLNEKDRFLKI